MAKTPATPTPSTSSLTRNTSVDKIILFIGMFFVLLGAYSTLKVGLNFAFMAGTYPSAGIFGGPGMYGPREEDCYFSMGPYFDPMGTPRKATADEVQMEAQNKERCLNQVKESRQSAKVSDISTIAFFWFLGLGILASKKWVIK